MPGDVLPNWEYQKRSTRAWNPPSGAHYDLYASPTVAFHDMFLSVQTKTTNPALPWLSGDDYQAWFMSWRYNMATVLLPWPQGVVHKTFWSSRMGAYMAWTVPPAYLMPIRLGANDATTTPPPTTNTAGTAIVGGPYYFAGQTPLWVDWLTAGGTVGLDLRAVLRSHANPFPYLASNDAWVGLGAEMDLKYSLGNYNMPVTGGYPLGNTGARAIIACHVSQTQIPGRTPGVPVLPGAPTGPALYIVEVTHYQADPGNTMPLLYEMVNVNDPGMWAATTPALLLDEIVATEITPVVDWTFVTPPPPGP
jgi:hypothetical protein